MPQTTQSADTILPAFIGVHAFIAFTHTRERYCFFRHFPPFFRQEIAVFLA
jgi:hypothetical protein